METAKTTLAKLWLVPNHRVKHILKNTQQILQQLNFFKPNIAAGTDLVNYFGLHKNTHEFIIGSFCYYARC